MATLVKVQYVGKKPTAFDNITRSGKVWNGNGDIQEVTDAQARELIKYPDQWALVDLTDQAAVDAPVSITATNEDGEEVTIEPDALKKPLEKMTKVELVAYAKQVYGKELDASAAKKLLIDQIEELGKGMDPIPAV